MDIVGQLQPNKKIQFVSVSMEDALRAREKYNQRISEIKNLIK